MLASEEAISSIRENVSVLSAARQGHFARGYTAYLGGSHVGIYRAEILCSYCGGHLKLRKESTEGRHVRWELDGDSQSVLSELCDARHEAIEERYRRIFRNLDEAQHQRLASQNRRAPN